MLCVALALLHRPRLWSGEQRRLNQWATAVAIVILVELVPLPAPVIDLLSPHARDVWQALSLRTVSGSLPLSVDLWATVWALGIYCGALATFFVSQSIFATGGVRTVARGIASTGLLLTAVGLAQDATAHGLIYWRWPPPFAVAPPFGPFFNRDHYATWVVMAVPTTFGYLLAHASAHAHDRHAPGAGWRERLRDAADARSIWLAAAICLMLVGLVASLSRAGMAGLFAAVALGLVLRRRQSDAVVSGWVVVAVALAAVLALSRVDPLTLVSRLGSAGSALSGRVAIWRATLPVLRDFWLTGTGAGTFETVMLVYQRSPSLFRINAAHNHYLQVLTEGGVLMAVPLAIAGVRFARAAADALRRDHSGMYLVRAGALSGLAGVAVQSLWETGLMTPANALLAAVLAAIVIHPSSHQARRAS